MNNELLVPTVDFSPAKAHLSDVMTDVFHQHQVTIVSRHHGKERMVLVRPDDLLAMLPSEPFETEVVYDAEGVAVAVPALGVMGVGDTTELAIDDLLVELRAYAKRFFESPARYFAAGQGDRAASLLGFALADEARQRRLVIGDPESRHAAESLAAGA
jgi:hypothetical protein